MSLAATRWAWTRKGIKASDKLILLSLADRANEKHRCYPSVARLSYDTCLNRKTVMDGLSRLEKAGLLRAEKRSGAGTNYELVGVHDYYKADTDTATGANSGAGPKSGTAPVPKTGPQPVPKTGHESTNEPLKNLNSPRSRKTRIPDDFSISPRVRRWASEKGCARLSDHFEHFVGWARSKGATYVDWDEALMTAIRGNWARLGANHETRHKARSDSVAERAEREFRQYIAATALEQ